LDDGVKKAGGDDAKARFTAAFVERTRRYIAGEVSAEGGDFVVHPERELRAMAPERGSAEHKNGVAETRQKTKR